MHRYRSLGWFVLLGMVGTPWVQAATATATATITATIPTVITVALVKDINSGCLTSSQIAFTTLDAQDMPGGSLTHMYAPLRSQTGKNCFVVRIDTNAPFQLSTQVSGSSGSWEAASQMEVWAAGFFADDTTHKGGASTAWESLVAFKRAVSGGFSGVLPLNFRARIAGVVPGAYTGTVTFTLTTT